MSDQVKIVAPSVRLFFKITDLISLVQDCLDRDDRRFNWQAAEALINDPAVQDWLEELREEGLLGD